MAKNKISFAILLMIICVFFLLNIAVLIGQKSVMILHNNGCFDEPELAIIRINNVYGIEIIPIIFPEDLMQLIECCKQDTIQFFPVDSYLKRTNSMTKEDRLFEENYFLNKMKRLKKEKKKIFRIFNQNKGGVLGLNLHISICECVIDDPSVPISRLVLIKSISFRD